MRPAHWSRDVAFRAAGIALAAVVWAVALLHTGPAAKAEGLVWHLDTKKGFCGGDCGLSILAGKGLHTGMKSVFGVDGFVPPWQWQLDQHYLISIAGSRRIVTVYNVIDVEAELGIGQRFGGQHETEFWGALYFRWKWFPWNDHLVTTAAISTGLNWATGVSAYEEKRGDVPGGSRLLHYLSPEVTFALPSNPDWELVVRLHHRSGGGKFLLGDTWLFHGVTGGSQFITAGVRHRF